MSTEKEYGPNDNPVLYQESLLTEIERLKDLNFDLQKQVIPELEARNDELEKQIEHFKLISADHSRALDSASELEKKLEIAVEALEFYAKTESWEEDGWIANADLHEPWGDQGISLGGNFAIEALAAIKGGMNDQTRS